MATGDVTDLAGRIRSLLPPSWFGDTSPVLNAILQGAATALVPIYSTIQFVKAQGRLATSISGFVDLWAADYFGPTGLPRRVNEPDAAYIARIKYNLTAPRGTREGMIEMLTQLTGRAPKVFEPGFAFDTGGYAGIGNPTAGGGRLGYDDGTGTKGAGGWGSNELPFQFFITAYRPKGGGIANIGGYGSISNAALSGGLGGYGAIGAPANSNAGAIAWTNPSMAPGNLTDAEIYATIAAWTPAGYIAWVELSN